MNKNLTQKAILAVALSFGASTTHAALTNNIMISNSMTGDTVMNWMDSDLNTQSMGMDRTIMVNGDVTRTMGSHSGIMGEMPVWDYSWDLTSDPDPFIEGSFTVTNTSSMMQTFNIVFSLDVDPAFNNGYMSGNLSGIFSDLNDDGVTLNINSWNGLIDGTSQLSLFAFGGTFSAGSNVAISSDSESNVYYSGPVNDTIGINMNFSLSSGDAVTFNTDFEVTPVPVPAAVWLFGSGLIGLAGIARRKKS